MRSVPYVPHFRYAQVFALWALLLLNGCASVATDPLPSWNDGKVKQSIVSFVAKVTTPGSPDFVPVPERIATFDNDGTLWAEQPLYSQMLFVLDRIKVLAPQHPEWKTTEPFASVLKGALFTDYYAQQSCTAGRAAFILGQSPFRTGLLKVGLPGAPLGIQDKDPTIAQLLKPYGYATAQIGKNHLGDRNQFLPTVHGFDEFYGILYHLNAMEEPYQADYPKDPKFRATFGPRNIVDTKASTRDDATTDPRWGKVGRQTIVDGGPLPPHPNMDPAAKTNMEVVDEELVRRSLDFIDRSVKAGSPFFLWHNATRMHVWTHLSPKWTDKSGYGLYADGLMELDWEVGELLKKLDDLGIADNTIVIFTSDNGAEIFSWPDGGNHPFRGEKGTTYEGGFRVPMLAKWPGTIKPGTTVNEIISGEDWMPTLLAAAGDSNVKEKLLKGMKVGDKTFKVYLDGYNFMPYFKGEVAKGPRREFFYFTDNGDLTAVRYDDWKLSFKTIKGNLFTGTPESTNVPLVTNLRQDPWERYQEQSMMYARWWGDKLWTLIPGAAIVGQFLQTFKEFPPSQVSSTFGVEQALRTIQQGVGVSN